MAQEPIQQKKSNTCQKWENSKYRRKRRAKPLDMAQLKALVLDGTVMSGISYAGATSSAGHMGNPLIKTLTPAISKNLPWPHQGENLST